MTSKLLIIFILVFTTITGIYGAPLTFSLYDEFIGGYLKRNCSIPPNVVLPEMVVDKNFSVPLKICKNEESEQNSELIDMQYHICSEILELLEDIACLPTTDTPDNEEKLVNITISSDVCRDFLKLKPVISNRYAISRLKEYAVCSSVCKLDDMNKACVFFLWSYEVFDHLKGTPNEINDFSTKDSKVDSSFKKAQSSTAFNKSLASGASVNKPLSNDKSPELVKSKQNKKSKVRVPVTEKEITETLGNIASSEMLANLSSESKKSSSEIDPVNKAISEQINDMNETEQNNDISKAEKSKDTDKISSFTAKNHSVVHNNIEDKLPSIKSKMHNTSAESSSQSDKAKESVSSKSISALVSLKSDSHTKSSSSSSTNSALSSFSKIHNSKTESSKTSSSEKKFTSFTLGIHTTTNSTNAAVFVNTIATDVAPLEEMENSVNEQGIQDDEEPSDTSHIFDGKSQNEFNENSFSSDVNTEDSRNSQRPSNVQSVDSSKDTFGSDVLNAFDATFPEQEDNHFFFYLVSVVAVTVTVYILYHNRQKILALIIEGRHERRRRSHGVSYKKLET